MKYKLPDLSERRDVDRNAKKLTHEIAITLRKGGFSVSDIADQYQVSVNTVRRRLHGDLKKMGRPRGRYTQQAAQVALSNYDSKGWSSLPSEDQDRWVEEIYAILSKTEFPYPSLPDDPTLEYQKLCALEMGLTDGYIRPGSYRGLSLCYPFFPNRFEAVAASSRSARESWEKEKYLRRAIKYQLKVGDPVTPYRVLRAITMNTRTPSIFKPSTAKYLYDTYGNKGKVWDPCAGYGGRLLAAMVSGVHYTATDVEPQTIQGNVDLANFLGKSDQVSLHLRPAEDFDPPDGLDLVFTSPPYFEAEKYSTRENQSYIKHGGGLDSWLSGFLDPVIRKSFSKLKSGGVLVINIADVKRRGEVYPLVDSTKISAQDAGFLHEETLKMPLAKLNRDIDYEPVLVFRKSR
jgi:hypothetical protein